MPEPDTLLRLTLDALEEMKAFDVKVLNVQELTDVTDRMIVASGTSDRHVRAIATNLVERAKAAGHAPLGVEGEKDGQWVLVDLLDVVVHVMLPRVRDFYQIEKLWSGPQQARSRTG